MTLWTSETGAKLSHNRVLGIGMDSPETSGYRSSEGNESGKDECVHTATGDHILSGDGV